jgi:hypothetical protein
LEGLSDLVELMLIFEVLLVERMMIVEVAKGKFVVEVADSLLFSGRLLVVQVCL